MSPDVEARLSDIQAYRTFLKRQCDALTDNALSLRSFFVNLEWNDAVYDDTQTLLNRHFASLNALLKSLQDAQMSLRDFEKQLQVYLSCV